MLPDIIVRLCLSDLKQAESKRYKLSGLLCLTVEDVRIFFFTANVTSLFTERKITVMNFVNAINSIHFVLVLIFLALSPVLSYFHYHSNFTSNRSCHLDVLDACICQRCMSLYVDVFRAEHAAFCSQFL